jgi:hypothetical protein
MVRVASHRGRPPVFRARKDRGTSHGANPGAASTRLPVMYAQLIEFRSDPARLDLVERQIRRDLMAALRGRTGFSGAVSLIDRERATSLLVLLWETKAEAVRSLPRDVFPFDASLTTVWEVDARA